MPTQKKEQVINVGMTLTTAKFEEALLSMEKKATDSAAKIAKSLTLDKVPAKGLGYSSTLATELAAVRTDAAATGAALKESIKFSVNSRSLTSLKELAETLKAIEASATNLTKKKTVIEVETRYTTTNAPASSRSAASRSAETPAPSKTKGSSTTTPSSKDANVLSYTIRDRKDLEDAIKSNSRTWEQLTKSEKLSAQNYLRQAKQLAAEIDELRASFTKKGGGAFVDANAFKNITDPVLRGIANAIQASEAKFAQIRKTLGDKIGQSLTVDKITPTKSVEQILNETQKYISKLQERVNANIAKAQLPGLSDRRRNTYEKAAEKESLLLSRAVAGHNSLVGSSLTRSELPIPPIYRRAAADSVRAFEEEMRKLTGVADKAGKDAGAAFSDRFSANFLADSASRALGFISRELFEVSKKTILYAARTDELKVALESMARANKLSYDTVLQQQNAVQSLNITTQDATQTLSRFIAVGFDLNKAAPLARVAQDLAVIGGFSTSEELEKLMVGIQTLQSRNLRTAGVYITVDEVLDKLSATTGRARDSFSTLEKQQAVLNAVMEYGSRVAGTYEASMETASKRIRSMEREVAEAQNALGEQFQPALLEVVKALSWLLNTIKDYPGFVTGLISSATALGLTFAVLGTNLIPAVVSGTGLLGKSLTDAKLALLGKTIATENDMLITAASTEAEALRTREVLAGVSADEAAIASRRGLAAANATAAGTSVAGKIPVPPETTAVGAVGRATQVLGWIGLAVSAALTIYTAITAIDEYRNAAPKFDKLDINSLKKQADNLRSLEKTKAELAEGIFFTNVNVDVIKEKELSVTRLITTENRNLLEIYKQQTNEQTKTSALLKAVDAQINSTNRNRAVGLASLIKNAELAFKDLDKSRAKLEGTSETYTRLNKLRNSGIFATSTDEEIAQAANLPARINRYITKTFNPGSKYTLGDSTNNPIFLKNRQLTKDEAETAVDLYEAKNALNEYSETLKESSEKAGVFYNQISAAREIAIAYGLTLEEIFTNNKIAEMFGDDAEAAAKFRKELADVRRDLNKDFLTSVVSGFQDPAVRFKAISDGFEKQAEATKASLTDAFRQLKAAREEAGRPLTKQEEQLASEAVPKTVIQSFLRNKDNIQAVYSALSNGISQAEAQAEKSGRRLTTQEKLEALNKTIEAFKQVNPDLISAVLNQSQTMQEASTFVEDYIGALGKASRELDNIEREIGFFFATAKERTLEASAIIRQEDLTALKNITSLQAKLGKPLEISPELQHNSDGIRKLHESLKREEKTYDAIKALKEANLNIEQEIFQARATLGVPLVQKELVIQKELLALTQAKREEEQKLTTDIAVELQKRERYANESARERVKIAAEVFLETQKAETDAQKESIKAGYAAALSVGNTSAFDKNPIIAEAIQQSKKLEEIQRKGGLSVIRMEEHIVVSKAIQKTTEDSTSALVDITKLLSTNLPTIVNGISLLAPVSNSVNGIQILPVAAPSATAPFTGSWDAAVKKATSSSTLNIPKLGGGFTGSALFGTNTGNSFFKGGGLFSSPFKPFALSSTPSGISSLTAGSGLFSKFKFGGSSSSTSSNNQLVDITQFMSGGGSSSTPFNTASVSMSQASYADRLYSTFIRGGLSPAAALALVSRVGAESGLSSKYLNQVGTNADPHSGRNWGPLQHQGNRISNSRGTGLLDILASKGFSPQAGNVTPEAYAEAIIAEMNGAERGSTAILRDKNLTDMEQAFAGVQKYIRYRVTGIDPNSGRSWKDVNEGKQRAYAAKLSSKLTGQAYVNSTSAIAQKLGANTQNPVPETPYSKALTDYYNFINLSSEQQENILFGFKYIPGALSTNIQEAGKSALNGTRAVTAYSRGNINSNVTRALDTTLLKRLGERARLKTQYAVEGEPLFLQDLEFTRKDRQSLRAEDGLERLKVKREAILDIERSYNSVVAEGIKLDAERLHREENSADYIENQREKFVNAQKKNALDLQDAYAQLALREDAYINNAEYREQIISKEVLQRRENVQALKEELDYLKRYYVDRKEIALQAERDRVAAHNDTLTQIARLDEDALHKQEGLADRLLLKYKQINDARLNEHEGFLARQLEQEVAFIRKQDKFNSEDFRGSALEKINGGMRSSTELMVDLFNNAYDGISNGFGSLVDKMTSKMGIFGNAIGGILKGIFNNVVGTISKNILDQFFPVNDIVGGILGGATSSTGNTSGASSVISQILSFTGAPGAFGKSTPGTSNNPAANIAIAGDAALYFADAVNRASSSIIQSTGYVGGTAVGVGGVVSSLFGSLARPSGAGRTTTQGTSNPLGGLFQSGLGAIAGTTNTGLNGVGSAAAILGGGSSIGGFSTVVRNNTNPSISLGTFFPARPVSGVGGGVLSGGLGLLRGISPKSIGSSLLASAPLLGAGLGSMLGGGSGVGGALGQVGGLLGGVAAMAGLSAAGIGGLGAFGGILGSIFGTGSTIGAVGASGVAGVAGLGTAGTGLAGALGVSTALASTLVLAPIAAAFLVGSWLYSRNKRRRAEERIRNQAMLEALPALQDLLKQVRTDKIDGAEAISRAAEIRKQYIDQMSQLKDKKTRNIALQDVSRLDTVIDQIKAAAAAQKVRQERNDKIVPTYAGGGVAAGMIRVSKGEDVYFPISSDHLASAGIPGFAGGGMYIGGTIPGTFDGRDNILMNAPKGTVIANPAQARKARQARGFASGGVYGGGIRTAHGTAPVQPPSVTAIVVFSEEDAIKLGSQIPGQVFVTHIREHVRKEGTKGLSGDIYNSWSK